MRKFIVHPTPTPTQSPPPHSDNGNDDEDNNNLSLLLWIFTPDLLFSSSLPSPSRHDPTRAMKIFYQRQSYAPLQPGDPEPAHTEDIAFPPDLYDELDCALRLSQRLLPSAARRWREWHVGLLERFDGAEVLGLPTLHGGLEREEVD